MRITWVSLISWILAISLNAILYFLPSPFSKIKFTEHAKPPLEVVHWVHKELPVAHTARSQDESSKREKEEVRFGGEFKNRVEKETRARILGAFQENLLGNKDGVELSIDPEKKQRISLRQLLKLGRSPRALSEDIEFGLENRLNTDPVIYASFRNRISEKVRGPWVRYMEEVLKDHPRLAANVYTTILTIYVDDEGNLHEIEVSKSSGIKDIDEATRRAMWESEPFENPPIREEIRGFNDLMSYRFGFEFILSDGSFRVFGRI